MTEFGGGDIGLDEPIVNESVVDEKEAVESTKVDSESKPLSFKSHKERLFHYAKEYTDSGYKIVWTRLKLNSAGAKEPIFGGSWKNCISTMDEAEKAFAAFEKKIFKEPNSLAILTGEISNLFVVDLDLPLVEAKKFIDEWKIEIPRDAYSVRTQSGGIQIYFKYDPRLKNITTTKAKLKLPDGSKCPIDIRGNGGICFAPPSRLWKNDSYVYYTLNKKNNRPGGLYPVPENLVKFLLEHNSGVAKVENLRAEPVVEVSQLSENQKARFDKLVEEAHNAPKGSRSDADMRAICYGVCLKLPVEYISARMATGGKCAELKNKGKAKFESYFNYTHTKALTYVRNSPKYKASFGGGSGITTEFVYNGKKIILSFYRFWSAVRNPVNGNIIKVKIEPAYYFEFLKLNNFYKCDDEFIRISDRVAVRYTIEQLKDLTGIYIEELKNQSNLINPDVASLLISDLSLSRIFNSHTNVIIRPNNRKLLRDTEDTIYLTFNNACMVINNKDISITQYRDLPDDVYIMSSDIIERDYIEPQDKTDSEFKRFVHFVTGYDKNQNIDRLRGYECAIGYLISTHKTPAMCSAVVFSDELEEGETPDRPQGGRGKGTTMQAISKCRKLKIIPAYSFDRANRFTWQAVDEDTRVILIDDIPRSFKIETIFSEISDGIQIERKFKKPLHLDFDKCPKFSVTTNYSIRTPGVSSLRRIHEVELTAHYNLSHTIRSDFGHNFFDDWNTEEWNRFYYYMACCCRTYLTLGLQQTMTKSIESKRLINETGQIFVEWMTEEISKGKFKEGEWYSVSNVRSGLIEADPDLDRKDYQVTHHNLRTWLESYFHVNKMNCHFGRKRVDGNANAVSCFRFSRDTLIETAPLGGSDAKMQ